MKVVKYPFSNLKNHHSKYFDLIKDLFETENFSFKLNLVDNGYVMDIYNVIPQPVYNPTNFEPTFRTECKDGSFGYIGKLNLFELYYNYLPDLIPYLDFNLYVHPNYQSLSFSATSGMFLGFNFREIYYDTFYIDKPFSNI